jgi:Ca2+-binding RTX toxin-like protein
MGAGAGSAAGLSPSLTRHVRYAPETPLVQPAVAPLTGSAAATQRPEIGVVSFSAVLSEDAGQQRQGGGGAVLVGGTVDDLLTGGTGPDLLLGGFGADRVGGNAANDILDPNTTTEGHDTGALDAIMKEWVSAGTASGTGGADGMTDSLGHDWF